MKGILFYQVTCRHTNAKLNENQPKQKPKKQEQGLTSLSLFKSADSYFTTKQTQSL